MQATSLPPGTKSYSRQLQQGLLLPASAAGLGPSVGLAGQLWATASADSIHDPAHGIAHGAHIANTRCERVLPFLAALLRVHQRLMPFLVVLLLRRGIMRQTGLNFGKSTSPTPGRRSPSPVKAGGGEKPWQGARTTRSRAARLHRGDRGDRVQ